MNIQNDPTMSTFKQFHKGYLLKAAKGQTERMAFNYAVIKSRQYNVFNSAMTHDYIQPTEAIFTSRLDLPFNKDDKVIMSDNRTMTVKTAEYEYNANAAQMGDGRKGWRVTLEGGA